PEGKTSRYDYLREANIPATVTGVNRQRLLHDLAAIQDPNETALDPDSPVLVNPREAFTYGTDPALFNFDRVLTNTIGGPNASGVPAGGKVTYDYQYVQNQPPVPGAFIKTTETDRRGNVTEYFYGAGETLLEKREFTRGFRAGEPEAFI